MCRCADVQMCRCADVQMCRCADVGIIHLPRYEQGSFFAKEKNNSKSEISDAKREPFVNGVL
jgi:hypothetical protein